jgi:hypothetical protein
MTHPEDTGTATRVDRRQSPGELGDPRQRVDHRSLGVKLREVFGVKDEHQVIGPAKRTSDAGTTRFMAHVSSSAGSRFELLAHVNHGVESPEALLPLMKSSLAGHASKTFDALPKSRFDPVEGFGSREQLGEVAAFKKSCDLEEGVGVVHVLRATGIKGAAPDLRRLVIHDKPGLRVGLADEHFKRLVEGGALVVRFVEHRRGDAIQSQREGVYERRQTREQLDALRITRRVVEECDHIKGLQGVNEGSFIDFAAELKPSVTSAELFANEGEESEGVFVHRAHYSA